MAKYYFRLGLRGSDRGNDHFCIYTHNKTYFCTIYGRSNAIKLRDFLNKEFILQVK